MKLTPGHLTLPQLRRIAREAVTLELDPASVGAIEAGAWSSCSAYIGPLPSTLPPPTHGTSGGAKP